MTPLPIDPVLPQLVEAAARGSVVLEAPPGAGKTTRVPPALDDDRGRPPGQIWVVEPRRLAARLSARRVAEERGERVGASVGYRVRFDDSVGPDTRVVFVTEGVLLRRLQQDPALQGIATVVFDEFHERHLQADLALALCRQLQRTTRPELRLVVMSATLEVGPIAAFLGDGEPAVTLRSEGRRFDVTIDYVDPGPTTHRGPRLDAQVAAAVRRLDHEGLDGDVLVFLPGAAEIRRSRAALAGLDGLDVVVLHGDLSADEQDRAIRPGPRRKIILSTNVAETSVTVEGVVAVIDSGLARVARHSPFTGLSTLSVQRVSRASATQRAGRAGRLRPGRCLRLYSRHDHDGRPLHDLPEVQRADLCEAVLLLAAAGVSVPLAFPWFEAPPGPSLLAAQALLGRLGALDHGVLTSTGRQMLAIPAHPRLARVLVEGRRRGIESEAALAVAVLAEGPIRQSQPATHDGPSDLDEETEAVAEARRLRFDGERLRAFHIDAGAAQAAERVRRELSHSKAKSQNVADPDAALGLCLLAGYPDRVARRRQVGGDEVVLCGGGTAQLLPSSVVKSAQLMLLLDAEWRSGPVPMRGPQAQNAPRTTGAVLGRLAVAVEPEWLLEAGGLTEQTRVEWNRAAGRAEVVTRLSWDELTLEENRQPPRSDEERQQASRLLVEQAQSRFSQLDDSALRLAGRLAFARAARPQADLPVLDTDAASLTALLSVVCANRSSLDELPEGGLGEALRGALTADQLRLLDQLAPNELHLKHGRKVRVEYLAGQPPWAASRLQDFFGMLEGPRIGPVALTLHLLAPNQRPVQVTNDLMGFWDRHYPALRRELGRRYPRHAWPEDPRTAVPDVPRRR